MSNSIKWRGLTLIEKDFGLYCVLTEFGEFNTFKSCNEEGVIWRARAPGVNIATGNSPQEALDDALDKAVSNAYRIKEEAENLLVGLNELKNK